MKFPDESRLTSLSTINQILGQIVTIGDRSGVESTPIGEDRDKLINGDGFNVIWILFSPKTALRYHIWGQIP
jgi:hypothetical protein